MSDLISRKYVVKELLKEREHYPAMVAERYSFGVKLPHRFNQAMRGGIRKALRIAETAPAVDAEPVRHGRWVYVRTDKYNGSFAVLKCSNCGHTNYAIAEYIRKGKWCPYCGAQMDAEE